ncbi:MAG: BlaI/MecI/CopY family transcriptional regulator [Deltaproteobacteria bacterium]
MIKKTGFAESYSKVLGRLEQEILDVLWANGTLSGKAVYSNINGTREIALTTVLTVIERLAKKGLLKKERREGIYMYSCAYSREEFASAVSQEVFKGIFEISASGASASFVDILAESDPDELDRLSALIADKKKELLSRRG